MKLWFIILIAQFWIIVKAQTSNFFNSTGQLIADSTLSISNLNSYPVMKGGEEKMINILLERIKYPDIAAENDIEGMVIVKLNFNETGFITESTFLRNPERIFKDVISDWLKVLGDTQFIVSKVSDKILYLAFSFKLTENDSKKYFENGTFIICRKRDEVIID